MITTPYGKPSLFYKLYEERKKEEEAMRAKTKAASMTGAQIFDLILETQERMDREGLNVPSEVEVALFEGIPVRVVMNDTHDIMDSFPEATGKDIFIVIQNGIQDYKQNFNKKPEQITISVETWKKLMEYFESLNITWTAKS